MMINKKRQKEKKKQLEKFVCDVKRATTLPLTKYIN